MNATHVIRHLLVLVALPGVSAGQNVTAARLELNRATSLLERGLADSALASYRQAALWAERGRPDSTALAEAYFGIATSKGAIGRFAAEPSRVEDYLRAAALDPARFLVAATNNAAQVQRGRGDHARSASLFLAAAREEHPARSYILLDAGQEWLRAERPESALAAFERAVRENPDHAAAVDALVELLLARRDYPRVLRLARATEYAAPSTQQIVARALVEVMADSSVGVADFDTALGLLASALVRVGAGPESFPLGTRSRLDQAGRRRAHDGVRSLLDAYGRLPSETRPPTWWDRLDERRATWTRTMTALAGWHAQRGDMTAARRYYECALGYPYVPIVVPWVDIEALVPLARIYAGLERAESDRFIRWVFDEKMLAYDLLRSNAPPAVSMVRRLHLTLGLMFAKRGQWGASAGDVYGAAFQLSHMREFTQRMQSDGVPVSDPPELTEELVYAYWAVGLRREAQALVPEVLRAYDERRQDGEVLRFRRIAADPLLLDQAVRTRQKS